VDQESDLVKAYRLSVKRVKEIPATGDRVEWLLTKLSGESYETVQAVRRVAKNSYERLVLAEALKRLLEKGEQGQRTGDTYP
jgi:NTP pyrophosphatase (non-canonical NTP hydrolase)